MESIEIVTQRIIDVITTFGPKLIGAIITLFVGWWIIKRIQSTLGERFEKRKMDPSLKGFLHSTIGVLLKIMLLISIAGMIGIEMTSFIAVLGAAGLAVGMALSGTLQNFAGGVMILFFKPFKSGDYIEAQGYAGTVSEIQIFNTILKTPDNKTIIIPNGGLSTSSMVNYSTESLRRVDFVFGIGYGSDVDNAKKIISKIIEKDSRILKEPVPFVAVSQLADSSVNLVVRVWAEAVNYWGVHFDMNENIYKTFNKEGISIPFPQMDVHVIK